MNTPLNKLKGIGSARMALFEKLHIYTVGDLLQHYPRTYHDLTHPRQVEEMRQGEMFFGMLTILSQPALTRARGGLTIVRCTAGDQSGTVELVWYNQPYRKQSLREGQQYYVYGRPELMRGELCITAPMLERPDRFEGGGLLPVYPTTAGLSQTVIRATVQDALQQYGACIKDRLPRPLREQYGLYTAADACRLLHNPPDMDTRDKAARTLAFEEMLLARAWLHTWRRPMEQAAVLSADPAKEQAFLQALGFVPTGAQTRVMDTIRAELASGRPMQRMVQGDVGSGKTAVAMYALYLAAVNGMQGAMMAPTEILAAQHAAYLQQTLGPLGIQVALLTSGMKKKERDQVLAGLADGSVDLAVGTHALLSEQVVFCNLAVAVADEQHRFGVRQRALLRGKQQGLHMLVMSATPIPRTLALVLYGDLDVSALDELPPGRKPVKTRIVSEQKREDMYRYVYGRTRLGEQAYVVCPRIEDGEDDRRAAEQVYAEWQGKFPDLQVGLLHGRMKPGEKQAVMEAFAENRCQVLVSTTVIEVGVNVPNACLMVIEEADRFGLAQLHQLRGRVGRGSKESWCFLSTSRADNPRLQVLCESQNGFLIAQADLEQRGPGELLGQQQHGQVDVRAAALLQDAKTLEEVTQAFSKLQQEENQGLFTQICQAAREKYKEKENEIVLN